MNQKDPVFQTETSIGRSSTKNDQTLHQSRKDNPEQLGAPLKPSGASKSKIFQQFIAGTGHNSSSRAQKEPHQRSSAGPGLVSEPEQMATGTGSARRDSKHQMPPKPQKQSPQNNRMSNHQGYPGQLQVSQQISNSKKREIDNMHTHFSNFGMQAIGGHQVSKVLQMKNQNLTSLETRDLKLSIQRSASKEKHNISGELVMVQASNYNNNVQNLSYDESKDMMFPIGKGILNQDDSQKTIPIEKTNIGQSQILDSSGQGGLNSLNQGLHQLQPQKKKMGERRHFPAQNEFEMLMKSSGTVQEGAPQKIKEHQQKFSQISQTTGGKQLVRRGAFSTHGISAHDSAGTPALGESSTIQQNRIAQNPKLSFQNSIFQMNRHKIQQIGVQTQDHAQEPSGTPTYKFQGKFSQNQGVGNLSQYGQNVFNRGSPKQQAAQNMKPPPMGTQASFNRELQNLPFNLNTAQQFRFLQDQNQSIDSSQFGAQIGARSYVSSIPQKSSSKLLNLAENPNNTSIGSNADQKPTSKENHFSPQPKPSSQMSQYETSKNMNSNTAQLIIRKAKAQQLEHIGDKRMKSLNKTDEKQKQSETQHIHNFRKYKKTNREIAGIDKEINVLGQPKQQYPAEQMKSGKSTKVSDQNQIGTGLYQNKRRNLYTNRGISNAAMEQTGLNLPSMLQSEKSTTNTATGTGRSSFPNQPESIPNSIVRKTGKQSIFNATTFSENAIQDVNYIQKENQQIAWEIKFEKPEQQNQNPADDNVSQDFIYNELKKHRHSVNKSPLIKQTKKNFKFRPNLQGQALTGDKSPLEQPQTNKEKVRKQIRVATKLINSIYDESPAKIIQNNRSIVFGGLQHLSQERNTNNNNTQDSQKHFIRQTGAIKLTGIRDKSRQQQESFKRTPGHNKIATKLEDPVKQNKIKIDESLGSKSATMKKSSRTHRHIIKQYDGQNPAEMIVTSFQKDQNKSTINSDIRERDLKDSIPKLKIMNFVGQTPKKEVQNIEGQEEKQEDQRVFNYENAENNDFFATTETKYFKDYMNDDNQQEMPSFNANLESSQVNPSANPTSEMLQSESESDLSRYTQSGLKDLSQIQVEKLRRFENYTTNKLESLQSESNMIIDHNPLKTSPDHQPLQKAVDLQNERSPVVNHSMPHRVVQVSGSLRWSGGISEKTQRLFSRVIKQNQKIQRNLILLQEVGLTNESNSLFKQIVDDIQAAESRMTKNEIIGCIKFSSFGHNSGIEPHQSNPENKLWLNIKRNQIQADETQKKKVHNSGDQSRGYSQYQRDFQIEGLPVE